MTSNAPKRTKAEREHDLVFIADRYLRQYTQVEIRDALNAERNYDLSRSQIKYDIKKIHQRWLKSSLVDFGKVKVRELARIDRLEREYWTAWNESKEDQEINTTSRSNGRHPSEKAEVKRIGQVGNPRFLDGVQWCIEQRMKIFGFYAPSQVRIDWRRQLEAQGINAGELFDELVGKYVEALEGGE